MNGISLTAASRAILYFVMISVTGVNGASAQSNILKIFSSDTNAAPYIMTDGVTFVSGIVKDLNDEAARRTKVTISYSLLSRKSVDATLLAGEGHLACNIQPAWTKIADQLVWTEPMFFDTDLFWRRKSGDQPNIDAFAALAGHSFATFKGYHHHAEATRLVADGLTKRVDLYPSESIFDVLLSKRADYIVFSKIRGDYLLKNPKYANLIEMTDLTDSHFPNYCAMSRKAPIDIDRYIRALNDIVLDGTLSRILARYR